ncbi:DAHP synthetase [Dimargaris cristalligena]|uniref:Phospho-2-dehydro-3-deoxyheptonate aldolase n=1 Tax=Dimargaris cristalligena TaxID=215637 RepID=A0A4P9ZVX6_9FUNG|nr:DAHP synthetase [Dimargaris cristalligena]|eukprot:RKP37101.1 DAHP synthetase [Dimargaris cristalligena]
MSAWTPDSWTTKPIKQDVTFPDPEAFNAVVSSPPLVCPEEVLNLREQLRKVALGEAFLLQGGDCAELFDYCAAGPIEDKLKVLLQMSLVLIWGAGIPVVRIARMAGQYAKPRSSPYESVNGQQIMSFRGDNVNGFDPSERIPDPQRLLSAYFHSAATLNYVRALLSGGFADLHDPMAWNLDHVRHDHVRGEYQSIVNQLLQSLDFMRTIGVDRGESQPALNTADIFMSHEGLILEYEQALTRQQQARGAPQADWFNLGTHFLWIGDRTRQLDGAHIEYFRGIKNPIGIKCGPSLDPAELVRLLAIVDSDREPGKVTLITRYGAGKIENHLPAHIEAVRAAGHCVVWACDPMHGNTESTPTGVKTRHVDNIMAEIKQAIAIHSRLGSRLNGIHLELTGERVTECVGGSMELSATDLAQNYRTFCDPRLNYHQSLDIAFLIAQHYKESRSN